MTMNESRRTGRMSQAHHTAQATRSWHDPTGPNLPRLHRMSYVLAVNAVGCTAYHEVALISVVAYTDGFTIQLRVRYPVGEGATPDPGPSQVTIGKVRTIVVEAMDDLGNVYRCRSVMGGGAGPGGDWHAHGEVHCDPVLAPEATAITVRLTLPPGSIDQPVQVNCEIPLMPLLGEIPAPAAARLARLPVPDTPVARPDLRPIAAADLLRHADLVGISAVARTARRSGVALTVLTMERYDRGVHLRLIVQLDDDHPDAIAHRTTDPAARDPRAWILNADYLHLTDDLGNRYPLRPSSVAGDRLHRIVSVTSPLPVPAESLAFRLDANEIVWCTSGPGGTWSVGERITADPGPFTVMFPRYPIPVESA
ncbi:hypothetical protein OIE68_20870 [Nocardia vinacea]|uniref:hypothetical protein n=1 Tax=Nocardia vinacea TaxID=96468 RepID=UPI002E0F1E16|nr:hypothetical protein OIE68_20870 [Nocardia vinacea]